MKTGLAVKSLVKDSLISEGNIVMTELQTHNLIAGKEEAGKRLDRYLASRIPECSRSRIQKLIKSGHVLLNGNQVKPSVILEGGESVILRMPPEKHENPEPEDIPLEVIYEDDEVMVINKQAGLVTHPAAGYPSGTLVNALLNRGANLSGIGAPQRPGIVHRLDKNTTGLIVVAKNDECHLDLKKQLQSRDMNEEEGVIDAPVGRDPRRRNRMSVNRKNGRPAITRWRVEKWSQGLTLLRVSLDSGRTHQIRVHLRYIGHPVIGDPEYGIETNAALSGVPGNANILRGKLKKAQHQLLHAWKLQFTHPGKKERMKFQVQPPELFREIISLI